MLEKMMFWLIFMVDLAVDMVYYDYPQIQGFILIITDAKKTLSYFTQSCLMDVIVDI